MIDIQITGPGKIPESSHPGDAGLDLWSFVGVKVPPHDFRDVDCGISLGLPEGYWVRITGRSSTLRKRRLMVIDGTIDTGYTGRIFVGVWNMTGQWIDVEEGERLGQMIVQTNHTESVRFQPCGRLQGYGRGNQGFGSSGR